jgi:hypothetical protein
MHFESYFLFIYRGRFDNKQTQAHIWFINNIKKLIYNFLQIKNYKNF